MPRQQRSGVDLFIGDEPKELCASVNYRLEVELKGMPIQIEDWIPIIVPIARS
jgi:hypothetical protein